MVGKIVRGSKGGNRNREPVRAEDTLDSKEFATIRIYYPKELRLKDGLLLLKKELLVIILIMLKLV